LRRSALTARTVDGATSNRPPGLPDILVPGLAVVFCGINPATTSALAGEPFVRSSNRFWRVLYRAGFTAEQLRPEDARTLLRYGCGITAAVARATSQAADLTREEIRASSASLRRKIKDYSPQVIAFLGKAAFAFITDASNVAWGCQPARFSGAVSWVLPNPSGRNRTFPTEDLVKAYSELRAYLFPKTQMAVTQRVSAARYLSL
jgi:TDG/mug DNA glycosylase family protein